MAVAFRDENINKEKREKIHGSEHHAARLAITPREKPRSDQPRALYVDEHGTLYWFADASGNFNEAFVFTQDTYAADMPYAIGVIVDYDLDHRWTIPYGNINEPCPDSFFPTIWNCPDADEWKDISNASRMNTRGRANAMRQQTMLNILALTRAITAHKLGRNDLLPVVTAFLT